MHPCPHPLVTPLNRAKNSRPIFSAASDFDDSSLGAIQMTTADVVLPADSLLPIIRYVDSVALIF